MSRASGSILTFGRWTALLLPRLAPARGSSASTRHVSAGFFSVVQTTPQAHRLAFIRRHRDGMLGDASDQCGQAISLQDRRQCANWTFVRRAGPRSATPKKRLLALAEHYSRQGMERAGRLQ